MINWGLVRKTIYEGGVFFLACAIGLFSFAWFRVWVVSLIDSARFKQIVELIPKDWQKFSAVEFDWLVSYLGRTSLTLEEPMVVLLITAWVVVRGSDVVSGELSRGTMEMLLAQPVSRRQVYWTQVTISFIGLLLLCLLIWLGMTIAVSTAVIQEVKYPEFRIPFVKSPIPIPFMEPQEYEVAMRTVILPVDFVPGVVNLFLMGCFLLGLVSFISAVDRYRWRTLGIGIGIYFVSAMFKIAALAAAPLFFLKYFTFFTLFEPQLHVKIFKVDWPAGWYWGHYGAEGQLLNLGPLGCNLILISGCLLFLWAGARAFRNRDLPAPL